MVPLPPKNCDPAIESDSGEELEIATAAWGSNSFVDKVDGYMDSDSVALPLLAPRLTYSH